MSKFVDIKESQISDIRLEHAEHQPSFRMGPDLVKQRQIIAEVVNRLFQEHIQKKDPAIDPLLDAFEKGDLEFSVTAGCFTVMQQGRQVGRIEDLQLANELIRRVSAVGSQCLSPQCESLPSGSSPSDLGPKEFAEDLFPDGITIEESSSLRRQQTQEFLSQFFDKPVDSSDEEEIDEIFNPDEIEILDLPGFESIASSEGSDSADGLKLLGVGKEKRVYDAGDHVVIEAQPGKEKDLAAEYQKIETIRRSCPDSQNLAVDMQRCADNPNRYQARKGKDLSQVINDVDNPLSLSQAYQFGGDLLNGMRELHQAGFGHGDIKPDNVLVYQEEGRLVAKITDFGKSKQLTDEQARTMWGNPHYSPPEAVFSFHGDVYGTGLLLVRVIEGGLEIPREATVERLFLNEVRPVVVARRVVSRLSGGVTLTPRQDDVHPHIADLKVPFALKELLWDMTMDDPSMRPTMAEALRRYNAIMQEQRLVAV